MSRAVAKLREIEIERAIVDFMTLDGWRSFKMELNFSPRKRKSVGEPGMGDRLFIRYDLNGLKLFHRATLKRLGDLAAGEILWLETKRSNGKPSNEQVEWHAEERRLGALTWIMGVDFPATIENFRAHYMASGLARKVRA